MNYIDKYKKIKNRAVEKLQGISDLKELEKLRVEYIGRKGLLKKLFAELSSIPSEQKPECGRYLNSIKNEISRIIDEKFEEFKDEKSAKKYFDPTLPAPEVKAAKIHPLKKTFRDIERVFVSMGFGVAHGPDVEEEYYNFTALNMPENHPARDMHDTFYVKDYDNTLLRTHTSPVQVRVMKKKSPPYKFIAPGKCYRRDTIDASHLPVFHQVEGLMVDRNISFSDLKGVLHHFSKIIFGEEIPIRFRPSFFPFTEPSAEMDIGCGICRGSGCSSCSGKGWVEILGAGMVDPEVFSHCGIDSKKWQGFAFGMGVERIAMLKYNIHDLRLFIQNDMRFLKQF
ncbi:MAG: phenylalanine--tRNA ligase subunit alpha [Elusimicrobiota bacterium]